MTHKVVAVFDKKTGIYSNPIACTHEALVIRGLTETVQSGQTDYGKYPEDYCLYMIGHYFPETGCIESFPPEALMELVSLKNIKGDDENDTKEV